MVCYIRKHLLGELHLFVGKVGNSAETMEYRVLDLLRSIKTMSKLSS